METLLGHVNKLCCGTAEDLAEWVCCRGFVQHAPDGVKRQKSYDLLDASKTTGSYMGRDLEDIRTEVREVKPTGS